MGYSTILRTWVDYKSKCVLRWDWKGKIGEMIINQKRKTDEGEWSKDYTISLYEGNAFMIMLSEYKNEEGEDMWNMFSFFIDKTHAKKCLGLQKNGDGELVNIFDEGWQTLKVLRINKHKSKNWKDIINLFTQAFDSLTIELYTEGENVE